jgi:hypothetical protein
MTLTPWAIVTFSAVVLIVIGLMVSHEKRRRIADRNYYLRHCEWWED